MGRDVMGIGMKKKSRVRGMNTCQLYGLSDECQKSFRQNRVVDSLARVVLRSAPLDCRVHLQRPSGGADLNYRKDSPIYAIPDAEGEEMRRLLGAQY